MIFNNVCPSFEMSDCNFKIQKDKEGTGWVVVFKDLSIANSYTLESSFCGALDGQHANCHFTPPMLEDVGVDFCRALHKLNDKDERAKAKQAIAVRYPTQPKEKASSNTAS